MIAVTIAPCLALLLVALVLARRFVRHKNALNIELTRDAVLCDVSWIDDDQELAALRLETTDLRIERTLAKGTLAIVFLARLASDERVAVKKIRLEKAKDAHAFAGLLAEVRQRSTLEHPKVVRFVGYCWGESMAELALVTEFMANGSLAALLKKQQTVAARWTWLSSDTDAPAKLLLAIDVAEALVYLHTLAEPVVHGEVQSRSVLLSSEWEAKLAGFGSKRQHNVSELLTTGGGGRGGARGSNVISIKNSNSNDGASSAGAVAWTAPEILKHEAFGASADVYAFGMLLAELDACANPYATTGLSNAQIALAVAAEELRPVFRTDTPPELVHIAHACLSQRPSDRPAAMKLHYDIHQLLRASIVVNRNV